MSKKVKFHKKANVLQESDYKTIKHLFSYELSVKQISDITGWATNTIHGVKKSADYVDYRQRNAERLKKQNLEQKKEVMNNPDPEIKPTVAEQPALLRIASALEELVEVIKSKRRIL